MIGYSFLSPAEEEMIDASIFYQRASQELGTDFLDEVQRMINVLRDRPKLGSPAGRGMRRTPLQRFPFSIVYAEELDAIVIIAIAHHSRRPGYWNKRLNR